MGKALILSEGENPAQYNIKLLYADKPVYDATMSAAEREAEEKSYLRNNVWCADLTTDLTGEVGTIEINNNEDIVIMPSGLEGLGQLRKSKEMSVSNTLYNFIILPGHQKWRPTFRLAEIITVDTSNNTCSVKILGVNSKRLYLNINNIPDTKNITEGEEVDPPNGWQGFKDTHPNHPLTTNTGNTSVDITTDAWRKIVDINSSVNASHICRAESKTDWNIMTPGGSGDSKDFALTKADQLIANGIPASALKMAVCETITDSGHKSHMVLTLDTDKGTYVLDNSCQFPKFADDTGYKWKSRLSGGTWNQTTGEDLQIDNVEVTYMDCGSSVFRTGDIVVVQFIDQDWKTPVIIGFKENPRPCPNTHLLLSMFQFSPIQLQTTYALLLKPDDTLELKIIAEKEEIFSVYSDSNPEGSPCENPIAPGGWGCRDNVGYYFNNGERAQKSVYTINIETGSVCFSRWVSQPDGLYKASGASAPIDDPGFRYEHLIEDYGLCYDICQTYTISECNECQKWWNCRNSLGDDPPSPGDWNYWCSPASASPEYIEDWNERCAPYHYEDCLPAWEACSSCIKANTVYSTGGEKLWYFWNVRYINYAGRVWYPPLFSWESYPDEINNTTPSIMKVIGDQLFVANVIDAYTGVEPTLGGSSMLYVLDAKTNTNTILSFCNAVISEYPVPDTIRYATFHPSTTDRFTYLENYPSDNPHSVARSQPPTITRLISGMAIFADHLYVIHHYEDIEFIITELFIWDTTKLHEEPIKISMPDLNRPWHESLDLGVGRLAVYGSMIFFLQPMDIDDHYFNKVMVYNLIIDEAGTNSLRFIRTFEVPEYTTVIGIKGDLSGVFLYCNKSEPSPEGTQMPFPRATHIYKYSLMGELITELALPAGEDNDNIEIKYMN